MTTTLTSSKNRCIAARKVFSMSLEINAQFWGWGTNIRTEASMTITSLQNAEHVPQAQAQIWQYWKVG